MEGVETFPPPSATPRTTPIPPPSFLSSQAHRVRRRLSGLHRGTKRARLQPSARASMAMPPALKTLALADPTAAGEAGRAASTPVTCSPPALPTRPRRTTVQSDIHEAILHPGNVRINVQGAFIVSDEPTTPRSDLDDYEHDPRDIRLPNHTAVVSHVAVDASAPPVTPQFTPLTPPRSAARWPSSSTSPASPATR